MCPGPGVLDLDPAPPDVAHPAQRDARQLLEVRGAADRASPSPWLGSRSTTDRGAVPLTESISNSSSRTLRPETTATPFRYAPVTVTCRADTSVTLRKSMPSPPVCWTATPAAAPRRSSRDLTEDVDWPPSLGLQA